MKKNKVLVYFAIQTNFRASLSALVFITKLIVISTFNNSFAYIKAKSYFNFLNIGS